MGLDNLTEGGGALATMHFPRSKVANTSPPFRKSRLEADIYETQSSEIRFVNEHPDYRGLVKQGIRKPVRHAPSFGG